MEIARGEVWWADLPDPIASSPGGAHPVLVVQATAFNRSRIATVIVAVITSNLRLAEAPGNVLLGPKEAGLKKPSVVNVSQIVTADKTFLHSVPVESDRRQWQEWSKGYGLSSICRTA